MLNKSRFKPKGDGKPHADTHGHDAPLGPEHPHHKGGEGYHTVEHEASGHIHHISHHEDGIHHSVQHESGDHHMIHNHGEDTNLMDGNAAMDEMESPETEQQENQEETQIKI